MISKLKARVVDNNDKQVTIVLADCIFFDLFVCKGLQYHIGSEYLFFVAMLFSAERGYSLYAFSTEYEKIYFLLLQECPGISSKLALLIVSTLSLVAIYNAIKENNPSIFENISGIGKKKAELLIIELKTKILKYPVFDNTDDVNNNKNNFHDDLQEALKILGYSNKEIKIMIDKVYKSSNANQLALPDLIQIALQYN